MPHFIDNLSDEEQEAENENQQGTSQQQIELAPTLQKLTNLKHRQNVEEDLEKIHCLLLMNQFKNNQELRKKLMALF